MPRCTTPAQTEPSKCRTPAAHRRAADRHLFQVRPTCPAPRVPRAAGRARTSGQPEQPPTQQLERPGTRSARGTCRGVTTPTWADLRAQASSRRAPKTFRRRTYRSPLLGSTHEWILTCSTRQLWSAVPRRWQQVIFPQSGRRGPVQRAGRRSGDRSARHRVEVPGEAGSAEHEFRLAARGSPGCDSRASSSSNPCPPNGHLDQRPDSSVRHTRLAWAEMDEA